MGRRRWAGRDPLRPVGQRTTPYYSPNQDWPPATTLVKEHVVKPIMNLDEVEFDDVEENGVYTSSRGQISDHIGAKKLGYNLTVLPPGKVQCHSIAIMAKRKCS
jgi:hypothetical protein